MVCISREFKFFPFHEFVHESKVRLDDDVETSCADKEVGSWKGEMTPSHDFCNTNTCRTTHADATVDQRLFPSAKAGIYRQCQLPSAGYLGNPDRDRWPR